MQLNDVLKDQATYVRDIAKAVPTMDVVDYLKTVQELRGVFGTEEAARAAAATSGKFDSLIGDKSYYNLARAFEKRASPPMSQRKRRCSTSYILFPAFQGKGEAQRFIKLRVEAGLAWLQLIFQNC